MTNRFASSAQDPSVLPANPLPAQHTYAERRSLQSNVQVPIGEAPGDTDIFGRIPTNVEIEPGSKLWNGAITGITSYDLGLYAELTPFVPDTTKGSAACLVAAKDIHTASSQDFSALITPDKAAKKAWEIAGLASDPGGFLVVVGTVHSAGGTASAAQWLDLHLEMRIPA